MIVESYFKKHTFMRRADTILKEIVSKTGFIPRASLFRGIIYDPTRLGSIILKGVYQDKPAVLKIEGLDLGFEETQRIKLFEEANTSPSLHAPLIYAHQSFSKNAGYGYLIMEYIEHPAVLSLPNPSSEERKHFLDFYQKYKTHVCSHPFVAQEDAKKATGRFIRNRIKLWVTIAKDRKAFDAERIVPRVQLFDALLEKIEYDTPMEFMHGHLSGREIRFSAEKNSFYILAHLFWDWRPRYYDTVFSIWWIWKNPGATLTTPGDILSCIAEWKQAYAKLDIISDDRRFYSTFDLLILERLLGTLIIDIDAQTYTNNSNKQNMYDRIEDTFDDYIKQVHI